MEGVGGLEVMVERIIDPEIHFTCAHCRLYANAPVELRELCFWLCVGSSGCSRISKQIVAFEGAVSPPTTAPLFALNVHCWLGITLLLAFSARWDAFDDAGRKQYGWLFDGTQQQPIL